MVVLRPRKKGGTRHDSVSLQAPAEGRFTLYSRRHADLWFVTLGHVPIGSVFALVVIALVHGGRTLLLSVIRFVRRARSGSPGSADAKLVMCSRGPEAGGIRVRKTGACPPLGRVDVQPPATATLRPPAVVPLPNSTAAAAVALHRRQRLQQRLMHLAIRRDNAVHSVWQRLAPRKVQRQSLRIRHLPSRLL